MPSELQRVAQELLEALNQIERIVPYLHDRAQKYREAAAWVGSTSSNQSARTAAMQLDEAARRCEEAAHFLIQARQSGIQWVQQMISGVRTAEPSGGSSGQRPLGPGSSTPPAERRKNKDQDKSEAKKPGKTAEAGDNTSPEGEPSSPKLSDDDIRQVIERLPARKPGDKTTGVWRDSDCTDHELLSGQHEDDFHAAQRHAEKLGLVRKPYGMTSAADVELKFAMRMRREGIKHAEIIINNKPCEGQLSCDELLERFLPDGGPLTVYGPDNFKRIYPKHLNQE